MSRDEATSVARSFQQKQQPRDCASAPTKALDIAVAFAGSIGATFPAATPTPVRAAACTLATLWICAAVNLAGVREAGRMQLLTTVLKLVPLLLFAKRGRRSRD